MATRESRNHAKRHMLASALRMDHGLVTSAVATGGNGRALEVRRDRSFGAAPYVLITDIWGECLPYADGTDNVLAMLYASDEEEGAVIRPGTLTYPYTAAIAEKVAATL